MFGSDFTEEETGTFPGRTEVELATQAGTKANLLFTRMLRTVECPTVDNQLPANGMTRLAVTNRAMSAKWPV